MKDIAMSILWGCVGAIVVLNLVNAGILPASVTAAFAKKAA